MPFFETLQFQQIWSYLVMSVYYGVLPSHDFHAGDSPVFRIVPYEG